MSDSLSGIIAQMRRLYHHMLQGARITPDDLSRQIVALEGATTPAPRPGDTPQPSDT